MYMFTTQPIRCRFVCYVDADDPRQVVARVDAALDGDAQDVARFWHDHLLEPVVRRRQSTLRERGKKSDRYCCKLGREKGSIT